LTDKRFTKQQIKGLKSLSLAEHRLEPLQLSSRLTQETADELVALGLAEVGACDPRYEKFGYSTGYRLTEAGWQALANHRSR
jgi:hypothetical protein